jgi:peptide/nickel transport system substrate-binding protein
MSDERAPDPDRLRIALSTDQGPVNPYSGAGSSLMSFVYDKLFAPSPYHPDPWPMLAERAEQIDSVTWVVTIRPGVRWHDGVPFTAEDVAFTFRYYRDGPPTRYAHHVSEVPQIDEIVAEDSLTVRFVCGYPCPTLARITLADMPVLPAHVWEGVTEPREYSALPVGTGPYRLVEYQPERFYRLEANPDYFLGAPAVAELIMPIIPNGPSALIALRTGEIDAAAHQLPPELEEQYSALEGMGIIHTSALSIVEFRPNYKKAPFDDPMMRRALSLAIDRDELVSRVLLGKVRPGDRGYPHPDSPWTDPTLSTPYDSAHAVAALDSAGFLDRDGDGIRERSDVGPLSLKLVFTPSDPSYVRVAEQLAIQLRRFGIELDPQAMEYGALVQQIRGGDYGFYLGETGAHAVADPDQFIMSHRTGYLWSRDDPYPAWDSLWTRWRAAATVDARKQVSFEMQRLFNRQPTSIALYYPTQAWAYRADRYDGWRESLGYGIVHKWSFVDEPAPPARRPV